MTKQVTSPSGLTQLENTRTKLFNPTIALSNIASHILTVKNHSNELIIRSELSTEIY